MEETDRNKRLLESYHFIGYFSENGLAAARKNHKWFHIHISGKPAYRQRYNFVGSFHQGIARAKKMENGFISLLTADLFIKKGMMMSAIFLKVQLG